MGKGFYPPVYFLAVAYGSVSSAHDRQDHWKIPYRREPFLGSDPSGCICRLPGQSSGTGKEGENGGGFFSHTASDPGRDALSGRYPGTAGVSGRNGRTDLFRLGKGKLAGTVCVSPIRFSARCSGKCKEAGGYGKSYAFRSGSTHRTSDPDPDPASGKLRPGRL